MPADSSVEICRAIVEARNGGTLTPKQIEIAIKADMFLAACAKTGLDALIDEVTGSFHTNGTCCLGMTKLELYIELVMRLWEKTFPDERVV